VNVQHKLMLLADKDLLQKRAAVQVITIRERELSLYARNTHLLGTVSAITAGIAYYGFVYVKMDYFQVAPPIVKFFYTQALTFTMCLAMRNLLGTVMLSMLGPGLALRGREGAIHKAVDGMLDELGTITTVLHQSVYCALASVLAYAWGGASPSWMSSMALSALVLVMAYLTYARTKAVEKTFPLHEMDSKGSLTSGMFATRDRLDTLSSSLDGGRRAGTQQSAASSCARHDDHVTRQPQPTPRLQAPRQRPQPADGATAARTGTRDLL
jgi:hypothetical protein